MRSAPRHAPSRQPDGSFVLSGEKMWITNGGFADLFIVFAKVDAELFTAFLVERSFPGVSTGQEEHKLGLHGSSTTPLLLQDVQAFLRAASSARSAVVTRWPSTSSTTVDSSWPRCAAAGRGWRSREAAGYAVQRRQFGQPIATFGAIRHKLGEMAIREYADRGDALPYRRPHRRDAAGQPRRATRCSRRSRSSRSRRRS